MVGLKKLMGKKRKACLIFYVFKYPLYAIVLNACLVLLVKNSEIPHLLKISFERECPSSIKNWPLIKGKRAGEVVHEPFTKLHPSQRNQEGGLLQHLLVENMFSQ